MWQPTDELTLIWCGKPFGRITNLSGDQPWMHADFAPNADAAELRPFFDACTDEDNPPPDIDSLFDATLFDDSNWFVADSDGTRRPIFMPAVHWADGDISWRWRTES
ncbi:MAG: hypothetical protein AAF497_09275 [Planctomycetota bacterium]